jgi:miniconductance mechanosensitive channel
LFDNLDLLLEKSLQIVGIILVSYLSWVIFKKFLVSIVHKLIQKSNTKLDDFFIQNRVLEQISFFVPLVIFAYSVDLFSKEISEPLMKLVLFLIASNVVLVIIKLINTALDVYNTYEISKTKPIKSYLQLVKLFVYIVGSVIAICLLIGVSPLAILSGLGAITAILLIVFKDTILSLVATVQIFANDLVREGDWIEVKAYGADGDVKDISLHTIKVQNFDKTIVSIPTYKLLDSSFKNYRGMVDSGARRIKRAISIDIDSIVIPNSELIQKLSKVNLIKDYIADIETDYDDSVLNHKVVNNLTIFREYLNRYLTNHPKINNEEFTFLIRELSPSPKGLPIELYIFSSDNRWIEYERIQSNIFDHILIAIKEFELKVYQDITNKE